jgi:hypothetical protein
MSSVRAGIGVSLIIHALTKPGLYVFFQTMTSTALCMLSCPEAQLHMQFTQLSGQRDSMQLSG